jgi:hypothetical protein
MSPHALLGWLIAALVTSLATMLLSASRDAMTPAGASAALFTLSVLTVGLVVNQRAWKGETVSVPSDVAPQLAAYNGQLMALVYAWGGLLLLVVYPFTGIKWYHAYQYGIAMGLFAIGLFAYSRAIASEGSSLGSPAILSRVMLLTMLQGIAAIAGLVFLIGSGKVWSTRVDWLANVVFLFGGLAIVGLSAIATITQRKLLR